MRNNEKTDKAIITSLEQVEISFKLLLQKKQKEELEKGIYLLLDKLNNDEVNKIFDSYPRLLQKYGLKEMFSGRVEIPNISTHSIKAGGLLTCLQFLIPSCLELLDKSGNIIPFAEVQKNDFFKPIEYTLYSISLDDFVEYLFLIIISIVGEQYYSKFLEKMGKQDFTAEDILELDIDPELDEHIDLMLWFATIRLFLESLYFYFNPENHNSKI